MYLCDLGHEEIVHESRSCPLCAAIGEKEDLENKVSDMKAELDDLERTIGDNDRKIGELEAKLQERLG